MIRALVVDDEPPARERVRDLLHAEPDVELVGEAGDAEQAVERIRALRPDLVFLDVQMPGRDGFGVLRALGAERPPATIFTTAHDEFAVRAFDVSAVDYLLKPLRRTRFRAALVRARERLSTGRPLSAAELQRAVADAVRTPAYLERLAVRVGRRIVVVRAEEVRWIEAEGNYARIHAGGKHYLLRQTLNALEVSLNPQKFVRVHRSAIVGVDHVREVHPLARGSYDLVLEGGEVVTTGQSYRERLQRVIGGVR
ncbi:MAG TPA: LytTR family DNA-binding domain-containing protein [Longimicrobium sp.]|nr:LytTR family DNA-binding domain-containing protein [Longimicrobium sp.]